MTWAESSVVDRRPVIAGFGSRDGNQFLVGSYPAMTGPGSGDDDRSRARKLIGKLDRKDRFHPGRHRGLAWRAVVKNKRRESTGSMVSGKTLRLNKIFRQDGRAVVVALDHASGMGPLPGIENPEGAIVKLVQGGVDAIMTTPGVITRFGSKFGRAGVILRVDGGSTVLGSGEGFGKLFGPSLALTLGADAVCSMGFAGAPEEYGHWSYVASLSEECQKLQIPFLVEALPRGEKAKAMTPEDAVAVACRVAAELGADFIKTSYPGSPRGMAKVVRACYVPILVLGGPKMDSDRALLETVAGALEGGAAGVCMGRNLWQHEHPDRIVAAIAEIVHEGSSVDSALKQL